MSIRSLFSIIIASALICLRIYAEIRLDPTDVLQFLDCFTLIPERRSFTVTNMFDKEIDILKVISSSSNFHPVLFQPSSLLPHETMEVQILFLPYYADFTESTLTVSSSIGDVMYAIRGQALDNPYRVRPLLDSRLVAGSVPFDQPIIIYNPYDEPLYVREVFTTEEFLSLKGSRIHNEISKNKDPMDLDGNPSETGEHSFSDNPAAVSSDPLSALSPFTIAPGTEKEVIMLTMKADKAGFYRGYVHIKTSRNNMVLPVELQVLDRATADLEELLATQTKTLPPSLKISDEEEIDETEDLQPSKITVISTSLDFGLIFSRGVKTVDVWLRNDGGTIAYVENVVLDKIDPLVTVVLVERELPASENTGEAVMVAQLIFKAGPDPGEGKRPGQERGVVNPVSVLGNSDRDRDRGGNGSGSNRDSSPGESSRKKSTGYLISVVKWIVYCFCNFLLVFLHCQ